MRDMNALTHLTCAMALTSAAVLAAFAMPLPAHAANITIFGGADARVVGSGHVVDAARPIGNFTALRIDGPVDVEAHAGPHPGVTVHAEDNIEPLIETGVEGETLVVRIRKGANFRTSKDLKVEIEFATLNQTRQNGSGDLRLHAPGGPRLESVIAGSGDLRIDGAQLGVFALRVAGSGDVQVRGRADEARFEVVGSGDVDAVDFPAHKVIIDVNGSGDVRVNALDAIDARISGSGDITYRGHPHDVARRISGNGSIEHDD